MKRYTRKQKLKQMGMVRFSEEVTTPANEHLLFEAELHLSEGKGGEPTGKEWEVTIIGARSDNDLVTVEGRTFILSKNGRLYDTKAIAESTQQWDGVKVYDNHLTQAEFEAKQGMRSPSKEWLGTIVNPRWDAAKNQLRGIFKVVEDSLAKKLKNAYEQKVLGAIGLSIDTFPVIGQEISVEGTRFPVIEGFKKILSVDLVGDPAAGGAFERLIAANVTHREQIDMENKELKAMLGEFKDELKTEIVGELPGLVKEASDAFLAEALSVTEAEEADETETEEVEAQEAETDTEDDNEEEAEQQEKADKAEEALQEARRLKFEVMLERKLAKSGLNEKQQRLVESAFDNLIVEAKGVDEMVKRVKEAAASTDPTGQVEGAGAGRIDVGSNSQDKAEVEFLRLLAGNNRFRALEQNDDPFVQDRLSEAHKSWIKDGRPNYGTRRLSEWVYTLLDGDPFSDSRAYEAITTSSMSSIVKNALNLMIAADYSVRERWWEPIVTTEEVDTIDQATLVRVYGMNTLSVVDEGDAYTELPWSDEEETASFVKKGNFAGITLETLLNDKLNTVRSIPNRLSNSWYNTLSALVSAVFTVNSNTGPVLADTGALFNATAVGTAGGHANLLTTAFGTTTTAYAAARLAMRKQTDQTLGAGRRLGIIPQYTLVPYDLEVAAQAVLNSENVPGSANNDINPYMRESQVIGVPDWTDANDWALVGDPVQFPAIYLIFLRGQQVPQLFTSDQETAGAMFTNDTLRYKVRMMTWRFSSTYDCAPVADFRPLHKSNVA